jgi:putative selenate reductase
MDDKFTGLSIERLMRWILAEEERGEIFSIPKELFFRPQEDDPFRIRRYGRELETPVGVAAGPHTQMAQNIISAWLTGARYIELKTVQTLDELEVTKPCIDMTDEGYNCEWSQELNLEQSFDEYLNAFILLYILKDRFGWGNPVEPGFLFNMSVGYNLEGILSPNVQNFLDKMTTCATEKAARIETLANVYPRAAQIEIPDQISDNITISTMHGCPPDEIERIGRYFITERKLHTTIKLNPTLLGSRRLREILNAKLGFEAVIPEAAFEHDLKFDAACDLIRSLSEAARKSRVAFNLKLTNTLEAANTAQVLPETEKMVYMSGRALHPVSINLAHRLQDAFQGRLEISFCAGADCFNLADILACNLMPVTVCSDLLKPGGYGRLGQYLEAIGQAMQSAGAATLSDFIGRRCNAKKTTDVYAAGRLNLEGYAHEVLAQKAFHKEVFPYAGIKLDHPLTPFDCIAAPCLKTCPLNQDIPAYLRHVAKGEIAKAFEVVLATNPFPNLQGMACDHPCQEKCTRINMDAPLKIRAIKRFIAESSIDPPLPRPAAANGHRAAVIGGGPSGLACAWFLALDGFAVEVFEAKGFAGGMAADAIPQFRLDPAALQKDIDRITALGVRIHYNSHIDEKRLQKIKSRSDYIYIGVGAQEALRLGLEGENSKGVLDQLTFLGKVKDRRPLDLGREVLVIGGGNAAMDAARTAKRLVGDTGRVTICYRRTRKLMPAHHEEIAAALDEGVTLMELTAPVALKTDQNRIRGVILTRMQLKEIQADGRPRPVEIARSRFQLPVDTLITAIGQRVVCDFLPDTTGVMDAGAADKTHTGGRLFVGGDAIRGASTLVKAIADGKNVAAKIIKKAAKINRCKAHATFTDQERVALARKKARRGYGPPSRSRKLPIGQRRGFGLVSTTLKTADARREAQRCLSCDRLCNVCVSVCPNRANIAYRIKTGAYPLARIRRGKEAILIEEKGHLVLNQSDQVLNIDDFCNQCGNCTTFCPTRGAPFRDKPKFYLTPEGLAKTTQGYYLEKNRITAKLDGRKATLKDAGGELIFDSEEVCARLNPESLTVTAVDRLADGCRDADIKPAVVMGILLTALNSSCIGA